jgi:putative DNA primase/helicase
VVTIRKLHPRVKVIEAPPELRDERVWLKWRIELDSDGEPKKVPFYANGKRRYGTLDTREDREQLVTFIEAVSSLTDKDNGPAIALGPIGDGRIVSGIDLDKCMVDGVPNAKAQTVIDAAKSYTEISPSGNGVHILGWGDIGTTKIAGLEIYSGKRYFTFTGKRL